MPDILIDGSEYKNVEKIKLLSSDGSDIFFGQGNDQEWFTGTNAELVATYSEEWGLADTSFVIGSSSSTSASNIKSSISYRFTSPTLDIDNKDIVVIQKLLVTPVHSESAVNKAKQVAYALMHIHAFAKRKTTDAGIPSARSGIGASFYMNKYYSSSGSLSRAQNNYGFYMTPVAPTLSSTTSATAAVRCNSPTLYYRVSSSYESSANIKLVTECTYEWCVEAYLCDPQTTLMARYGERVDDLLLNGIN